MLCGPETARMIKEFENASVLKEEINSQYRHHEDTPAFQKRFNNHYRNLIKEFEKLGNPFVCNGDETDLICMDTRDVMSDEVVQTVNQIEDIGTQKVKDFIQERLIDKTKPFDAPIKKNKLKLFSNKGTSSKALSTAMKKKLKKDVDLFSRLFISAQVRGGDVAEVFRHETRPEPPSLSQEGKIRGGVKSDLLKYMKPENPPDTSDSSLRGTVFEGSVLANTTKP